MDIKDLTGSCHRCGVAVVNPALHRQWHEQLEQTNERLERPSSTVRCTTTTEVDQLPDPLRCALPSGHDGGHQFD